MNKTKIDWCDSTWNPVTGCLHGCEYCYARNIAERFRPFDLPHITEDGVLKGINDLNRPIITECKDGKERICAYPYGFEPTLHRYKLNEYANKSGRNIFVCSMADLFGDWIPDFWLDEVFDACRKAPQHNYLFLTKNPRRYVQLSNAGKLPLKDNMWYGTSITDKSNTENAKEMFDTGFHFKKFLSIEPILCDIAQEDFWYAIDDIADWIIVGAETGRRKDRVVPERKWIEDIVNECRKNRKPVFMKSSLAPIWGEPLIQEFPDGLKR